MYDMIQLMANQRAPRNSLSETRIIQAARDLADAHGLEALTIRSLAAHLGVGPMSIYHHVPTKERMLDALVESVFAEFHAADPDGHWRSELAARARSVRQVIGQHPWALSILETRTQPGSANLAGHEAVLEVLHRAGFAVAAAAHAYAILDAFVYGFALQDAMLRSVQLDTNAEHLRAGMDLTAHPRLAEIAAYYVQAPRYPLDETFELGLAMVLDGIEHLETL